MFFWDRRSQFWIIIRLIMGHNNVTFWDRRSWYWDITRWIMGQNKVIFLGYWKVILVHIRRWSHGTFQDDNKIFHKMKNDLTTRTWQDNIWCPINIILLCFSDVGHASSSSSVPSRASPCDCLGSDQYVAIWCVAYMMSGPAVCATVFAGA